MKLGVLQKGDLPLGFVFFLFFFTCFIKISTIQGQWQYLYESQNNLCGGRFRFPKGSINFTYNAVTNPDPNTKKVCIWTIIANPFQTHLKFTLNSTKNMSCPSNDALGFTSFTESSTEIHTHRTCSSGDVFVLKGSVVVVTLISKNSTNGAGFYLSWDRPDPSTRYTRYRFVTADNTYGKQSSRPNPYITQQFMGNALATLAYPVGNRTTGYILQMTFSEIELFGKPEDCPMPRPGPGEFPFCNVLLICKLEDTGVLSLFQTYNSTSLKDVPTIKSPNGIFMIMWGGNQYNTTGGGKITYTYTHARGGREYSTRGRRRSF